MPGTGRHPTSERLAQQEKSGEWGAVRKRKIEHAKVDWTLESIGRASKRRRRGCWLRLLGALRCASFGFVSCPATPETLAFYLSTVADSGLKSGSIQRRVSAITAFHTAADHDSPTLKAGVRLTLAGIRRKLGTAQEGKAPVMTVNIAAMTAAVPKSLLGIRDRALLLLGFAGAFRRSELVGRRDLRG